MVYRVPPEAPLNILLADERGNAVDFEATPRGIFEEPLVADRVHWHTNHCRIADEPCTFENSLIRSRRWADLTAAAGPISRETVGAWLADT